MAGSSSNSSTPSLSVKLSDRGKYNVWKTQMIYFLKGHDMLGFIDVKFVSKGNEKAKMEDTEAWIRSDALVVSWILGTLSEEVTMYVVKRLTSKNPNVDFTAKDVWDELECIYGPKILQQAIGETKREKKYRSVRDKIEAHKKLYECIVKQKINSVNDVLKSEGVSVTDIITKNGNTALHVAVDTSNSKDLEFFEKMLEKTPENISLTDLTNSDGSTLLHMAATVGNTEAATFLMRKYPDMLYKTDKEGQTPLVVALSNMHTQFYWCLLDSIDKGFLKRKDLKRDTLFSDKLLELAISNKDFYLARNCIGWRWENLDSDAVLMAIAQNFPCELSFWERIAAGFAGYMCLLTVNCRGCRRNQPEKIIGEILTSLATVGSTVPQCRARYEGIGIS